MKTGFVKIAFAIKMEADDQFDAERLSDDIIESFKEHIKGMDLKYEITDYLIDACDFEEDWEEYEGFL